MSSEHTIWDSLLPHLTFANNTAIQSTTKFSPFRLIYGVDSVATIDTIFPNKPLSDNAPLPQVTCRLEEWPPHARWCTVETQSTANLRNDKQHQHVQYQDGQLDCLRVFVRKQCHYEKLLCKYVCPHRILFVLSLITCMVPSVDPPKDLKHRCTKSAHVPRPKSCIPPDSIHHLIHAVERRAIKRRTCAETIQIREVFQELSSFSHYTTSSM